MTQNNLGTALSDQAARTQGAKGAEILAQAATTYRSALEVYSAEAFPLDHERTEKQLKECERLLAQAKLQAQYMLYSIEVRVADRSGNKDPYNVDVFKGATGGIAHQKMLSWVGEEGPEAVIPLKRTPRALSLLDKGVRVGRSRA